MTSGKPGVPTHKRIETAERREAAVRMRMAGKRWPEIVEALGYASTGAACTDVKRALEEARKNLSLALDDLREQETQRLDELEARTRAVLDEYDVRAAEIDKALDEALAGGDDGALAIAERRETRLSDQRLAAVDRLLKISQRRSALLGLDQPTKVEHSGGVEWAISGVDLGALS